MAKKLFMSNEDYEDGVDDGSEFEQDDYVENAIALESMFNGLNTSLEDIERALDVVDNNNTMLEVMSTGEADGEVTVREEALMQVAANMAVAGSGVNARTFIPSMESDRRYCFVMEGLDFQNQSFFEKIGGAVTSAGRYLFEVTKSVLTLNKTQRARIKISKNNLNAISGDKEVLVRVPGSRSLIYGEGEEITNKRTLVTEYTSTCRAAKTLVTSAKALSTRSMGINIRTWLESVTLNGKYIKDIMADSLDDFFNEVKSGLQIDYEEKKTFSTVWFSKALMGGGVLTCVTPHKRDVSGLSANFFGSYRASLSTVTTSNVDTPEGFEDKFSKHDISTMLDSAEELLDAIEEATGGIGKLSNFLNSFDIVKMAYSVGSTMSLGHAKIVAVHFGLGLVSSRVRLLRSLMLIVGGTLNAAIAVSRSTVTFATNLTGKYVAATKRA